MERPDLVIVGSGIGGGGLATVLARGGLDVLVLERETAYRDKVRGETMFPWGGAEMRRVGLEEVFLAAGGGYVTGFVVYDELTSPEEAEAAVFSFADLVPGVPGQMNVGHPEACEALTCGAAAAGAEVLRGIRDIAVRPGREPEVEYSIDGIRRQVRPRLVIGADGRSSRVRAACGIELRESTPQSMLGGLLVGGIEGRDRLTNAIGIEGDFLYLAFPRPGGLVRLYLKWSIKDKRRFAGPGRTGDFLAVFRSLTSMPRGRSLADGTPAGPVGAYPMTEASTDEPFVEGVVLIGDAAGWSDPTIGQGLSVTMRDVRMVSEVLLSGDDWSPKAFGAYADERSERLRQLRIAVALSVLRSEAGDLGRARRRALPEAAESNAALAMAGAIATLGPGPMFTDVLTDDLVEVVRDLA